MEVPIDIEAVRRRICDCTAHCVQGAPYRPVNTCRGAVWPSFSASAAARSLAPSISLRSSGDHSMIPRAVRVALERWLIDFLLLAAAAAFFTFRLAAAFCFALDTRTPLMRAR